MSKQNNPVFVCEDLIISTDGKRIVNGVDITVFQGQIHAMMGPNGSGKSTFAAGVMGHPHMVTEGRVLLDGVPIERMAPHDRARAGLFLGFQYPVAVPGVTVSSFLRAVLSEIRGELAPSFAFRKELEETFEALKIPWSFAGRYLNDGFSGGEKKRLEILQMTLMAPRFAILDEIDSGLDVDALKTVAAGIRKVANQGTGVLLVTHYQRLLELVVPDRVHYFMDGRIAFEGGPETVKELETHGYDWLKVMHGNSERQAAR